MDISPTTLIVRNATDVNKQPVTSTVTVCLRYSGISLSEVKEVEYTLQADYQVSSILQSRVYFGSSVSTSFVDNALSLRFGMLGCINHTLTLKNYVKDYLNPISVHLSYRLSNDNSSMAPVLNPSTARGINKEIGFGRDCGDDDICQAELQLIKLSYSLISGRDEIYLGADSIVYISAEISNAGEEAHQARLTITHPENVVYEAVETKMSTDPINVKCEPVSVDDASVPYIDCSLGNPMSSNAKVLLQVRLDIGTLAPSQTELNISLSVSTSSSELDTDNNEAMVNVPVEILADGTIKGASTPEQLVYKQDKDNLPQFLKDVLKTVRLLSSSEGGQGASESNGKRESQEDPDVIYSNTDPLLRLITPNPNYPDQEQGQGREENVEATVNDTMIGPEFVQQFEVANLGPGRIPYASMVNISLPWRTLEGDWLVFITQVQGRDGVQACNTASVLQQQYQGILNHYDASSRNEADPDNMENADSKKAGTLRTIFNCTSAECVTLQCQIQPLPPAASAVIEIRARLWKHSFLKASYGLISMVSNASVQVKNPQGLFMQPDSHTPDNVTVKLTVSAEELKSPELPLPPWVIPVSTFLGVALLVIAVLVLSKLGFFRRGKVEEMKRRLMQEADQQVQAAAQMMK